ncbi:hypothetical protein PBY51_017023 [Eleginops maclovinus]|uniref:Uncharacterized protein n=1 Tax=Eleginops maclovinus TaxID=56733 RepID=A0AAN8A9F6_ELEMC|nr:hypothetical protein PBY51_017023 [Eleginops maclovinus]
MGKLGTRQQASVNSQLVGAETLAAALTLIQLKSHLFAGEAGATGIGGVWVGAEKASRFAQQLRGPTFAGSCMDSPSVPPLCPPPPPTVHTCSCLQQMFEVNLPPPSSSSSSSHKPKKKKNKKDTQKLPLAALRTPRPGEWEGGFREEEQRREVLVGKERKGGGTAYVQGGRF